MQERINLNSSRVDPLYWQADKWWYKKRLAWVWIRIMNMSLPLVWHSQVSLMNYSRRIWVQMVLNQSARTSVPILSWELTLPTKHPVLDQYQAPFGSQTNSSTETTPKVKICRSTKEASWLNGCSSFNSIYVMHTVPHKISLAPEDLDSRATCDWTQFVRCVLGSPWKETWICIHCK